MHQWLDRFLQYARKGDILVWDNLASHKNKEVLNRLFEAGVEVLFVPSRMAYILSPLDNCFFAYMKNAWRSYVSERNGKSISADEKERVLAHIYRNLTDDCVRSCFRRCGFPPSHDHPPHFDVQEPISVQAQRWKKQYSSRLENYESFFESHNSAIDDVEDVIYNEPHMPESSSSSSECSSDDDRDSDNVSNKFGIEEIISNRSEQKMETLSASFTNTAVFTGQQDEPVSTVGRGCACQKTGCVKRTCSCFKHNRLCTAACRCKCCENKQSRIDRPEAHEIIRYSEQLSNHPAQHSPTLPQQHLQGIRWRDNSCWIDVVVETCYRVWRPTTSDVDEKLCGPILRCLVQALNHWTNGGTGSEARDLFWKAVNWAPEGSFGNPASLLNRIFFAEREHRNGRQAVVHCQLSEHCANGHRHIHQQYFCPLDPTVLQDTQMSIVNGIATVYLTRNLLAIHGQILLGRCRSCGAMTEGRRTIESLPKMLWLEVAPNLVETAQIVFDELVNILGIQYQLRGITYYKSHHFYSEIFIAELNQWFMHDGLVNGGVLSPIPRPSNSNPIQLLLYMRI